MIFLPLDYIIDRMANSLLISLALFGFVLMCTCAMSSASLARDIEVKSVKCMAVDQPLGVDVLQLVLSWQLAATDINKHGVGQSAYRVLVASSLDALAKDNGDLWILARYCHRKPIKFYTLASSFNRLSRCFGRCVYGISPGRRVRGVCLVNGRWVCYLTTTGKQSGSPQPGWNMMKRQ